MAINSEVLRMKSAVCVELLPIIRLRPTTNGPGDAMITDHIKVFFAAFFVRGISYLRRVMRYKAEP